MNADNLLTRRFTGWRDRGRTCGRGEAVLLTGRREGKNPALLETQREAERRGARLEGQSCRTGGAYRPLVGICPRLGAPCRSDLAGVRPILARVLPAGSVIKICPWRSRSRARGGSDSLIESHGRRWAVLLVDDLQWADEDTISVLTYLADSVEELPLASCGCSHRTLLPGRLEPGLGSVDSPVAAESAYPKSGCRRSPHAAVAGTSPGDS